MSLIEKARLEDLEEVFQIYRQCDKQMQLDGFTYWKDYPKKRQTQADLIAKKLYKYSVDNVIQAVITLDEEQFFPWHLAQWKEDSEPALIVHRLAVLPRHQNKKLGNKLMAFAEEKAKSENYKSIRLDVSSNNTKALNFYLKQGYSPVGEVYLPVRDYPFTCFEKLVKL